MIIPKEDKLIVRIYKCGACHKIYSARPINISCAVAHAPGTCCHYTSKKISLELAETIVKMIREYKEEKVEK